MDYIIDTKRAELVLDAILDRYNRGAYPYNTKRSMLAELELPSNLVRGGEDEARWWFFSCMLMRGGINSDTALEALKEAYEAEMTPGGLRPFDPQCAAKLTVYQMTGINREAGTGLYRLGRDWINCAKILVEKYDGQVMQLIEQFSDYETATGLLRKKGGTGFPGFQYKMTSMLLFFLVESGLLKYFPYPPPVDFHLIRVTVATGIVKTDRPGNLVIARTAREIERLQEALRQMYLDYASRRGIRSNELSDAVWLHSRLLCRFNPGNATSLGEYNARSTRISPNQVDFNGIDSDRFERSCRRCPVRSFCDWNVPSAYYYTQGRVVVSERRDDSPIETLFDID